MESLAKSVALKVSRLESSAAKMQFWAFPRKDCVSGLNARAVIPHNSCSGFSSTRRITRYRTVRIKPFGHSICGRQFVREHRGGPPAPSMQPLRCWLRVSHHDEDQSCLYRFVFSVCSILNNLGWFPPRRNTAKNHGIEPGEFHGDLGARRVGIGAPTRRHDAST